MRPEESDLSTKMGPVEIDWPRAVGYFGAIALAVGFEVIEWPLGIFIAAIPFLRMLNRPRAPFPARLASQLLEGAAKPVGGDSEGTIHLVSAEVPGLPARNAPARGPRRARGPTASAPRPAQG